MINHLLCKTLNLILKDNIGSRKILEEYIGYSFSIIMLGFSMHSQIITDGFITPTDSGTKPTCTIKIPISVASTLISKDKISAIKIIEITGDTSFAHKLLEVLSQLHLSGVYLNQPPAVRAILRPLHQLAKYCHAQFKQISQNHAHSISEYLLYEKQTIVTSHEIEEFCQDVDKVKARTELINQKIKLLLLQA